MRSMGQATKEEDVKPILEINPKHTIIKKLETLGTDDTQFKDICHLLLGQAMLAEGIRPKNILDFNERLNNVLSNG